MENEPVLPRCFLILIQATESMSSPAQGECAAAGSKLSAAIELTRRLVAELVVHSDPLDLAVLAYTGNVEDKPAFHSLLTGTSLDNPWLSHASPGKQQDLENVPTPTGQTLAATALATATVLIQEWVRDVSGCVAPVLLHLLDEEQIDTTFPRITQSYRCLCTRTGQALLANVVLSTLPLAERSWPTPDEENPPGLLWNFHYLSSQLPDQRRAWALNTYPVTEILNLLTLSIPHDGTITADISPWEIEYRHYTTPKEGNTAEENEDALAILASSGTAALADGAGFGIYARSWAALLCDSAIQDYDRYIDPTQRPQWLAMCRQAWFDAIPTARMTFTKQRKIDTIGSGATLLTLRPEGGIIWREGEPCYRWQCSAVGDSCLFWIRDNRLRATFPAPDSRAISLSTPLLRTLESSPVMQPLLAGGIGKAGDFFLLMTDALALMFLQMCEAGAQIDWNRYWEIPDPDWQQEINTQRANRLLVNDDCTLLAFRIQPASPLLGEQS